eukprot:2161874-Lingulodinium_polyedra.AAC.1
MLPSAEQALLPGAGEALLCEPLAQPRVPQEGKHPTQELLQHAVGLPRLDGRLQCVEDNVQRA